MQAVNLSDFNTNVACQIQGVGVTDVPQDPYKTASLVIYVLVAVYMMVTAAAFMYMRQYRRRLKLRSLNPIVMGSIGSAIIILVRAVFNYQGRQFLPCSSTVTLAYLYWLLNLVPDNLALAAFLVKQRFRQQLMSRGVTIGGRPQPTLNGTAIAQTSRDQGSDSGKKASRENSITLTSSHIQKEGEDSTFLQSDLVVSPSRWFRGFWNYFLLLCESTIFLPKKNAVLHTKIRFSEDRAVGPIRELSYEFLSSILFGGALFFGLGMRVSLVAAYNPINGCTACILFWEDILIIAAVNAWLAVLMFISLIRTRDRLDPLGYRREANINSAFSCLVWIGYILAVVDPGDLMKQQKIDWMLFESMACLLCHTNRCVALMYRVTKIHKKAEQTIRLVDIIQDPRAGLLFEKYLMGELASENLLFWREGIKYKVNFDRNNDFDYSQHVAKVLFRTFVSRNAQLPINISGELREKVEARFRGGVVGKNVFDEALVEVYSMMQGGPFWRFIRTKSFLEYLRTKADFSIIPSGVALIPSTIGIMPLSDPDGGIATKTGGTEATMADSGARGKFNVTDYVRSL